MKSSLPSHPSTVFPLVERKNECRPINSLVPSLFLGLYSSFDLKYDRSGRSSGVAIISYETTEEATKAKKQFHGILAKGQPMEIAFDTFVPRPNSRRSVSAPTHSLLNRIQKPALAERLSADDMQVDGRKDGGGVGPIRTRPNRGGRGGKPGSKPAKSSKPPPKSQKPKTAEELDKELDAFMGDGGDSGAATAGTPVGESAVAADVDVDAAVAAVDATATTVPAQDVEMA
ncbi:hypothetical protein VKT23_007294 [Stygiomarasmius scandens]|uniref:Chromatin target of PRMT1 protein C-terminal domain-containing protein n=1 Tax=Marasmiellus scandens TaxID=2682957 RepID=A0ABR1JMQ2_9AGAR